MIVREGRSPLWRFAVPLLVLLWAVVPAAAQCVDGHCMPTWFPNALGAVLIGVGLMETFLGYRLFRVTLFLFGFSVTTVAVLLPIWDALSSSEPNAFYIALGVALVAGLAVGVLGAWMPKIGVFLVGAGLGAVVGVILGFTVLYKLYPANPNVPLGVAASVLGLALGILAVFIMRVTVVVSTSVVGAYMTVRGVMVYASPDLNESAIYSTVQSGGSVPAAWYGYAAGIVILALLGIVVQFMFTARKPKGKEAEKDVWEESYEEAELSLEALRTGGGKSKKGRRSSKKEARRSAKKARKAEKKRLKADALLHDYEPGGEFYEEGYDVNGDGGGGGGGGDGYYGDQQDWGEYSEYDEESGNHTGSGSAEDPSVTELATQKSGKKWFKKAATIAW